MKKITKNSIIFSVLTLASSLYANDGGSYGVQVRGINPENASTGVVAKEGAEISVKGNDAAYLAARLPHTLSVSAAVELTNKSLLLYSKAWTLGFYCQIGQPVELNGDMTDLAGPVKFTNEPTCTISLDSANGDNYISDYKGSDLSYAIRNKKDYKFSRINLIHKNEGSDSIETVRGTRISFYGNNIKVFKELLPSAEDDGVSEITLRGANATVKVGCLKQKVTHLASVGPETECFVEVK